jgi:phosphoribosylaminoimidazole (AIR) synthetase
MLLIAAPEKATKIVDVLTSAGETVYRIGALEPRGADAPSVFLENLPGWSR